MAGAPALEEPAPADPAGEVPFAETPGLVVPVGVVEPPEVPGRIEPITGKEPPGVELPGAVLPVELEGEGPVNDVLWVEQPPEPEAADAGACTEPLADGHGFEVEEGTVLGPAPELPFVEGVVFVEGVLVVLVEDEPLEGGTGGAGLFGVGVFGACGVGLFGAGLTGDFGAGVAGVLG